MPTLFLPVAYAASLELSELCTKRDLEQEFRVSWSLADGLRWCTCMTSSWAKYFEDMNRGHEGRYLGRISKEGAGRSRR